MDIEEQASPTGIAPSRFGVVRTHFPETDSTNARARELIKAGAPEGAAVTAAYQTQGRGRLDRTWLSDPGRNLLVSFIAYPVARFEQWGAIALLSGIAASDAIERVSALHPRLKWPNDVLIGGKKLAGILIETGMQAERPWAIIGIGINVNQSSFPALPLQDATSLALEAGRDFEPDTVLERLCVALEQWYDTWQAKGNGVIAAEWRARSDMPGSHAELLNDDRTLQVRVVDICEDGSLLVDNNGRLEHIFSGDVRIRTAGQTGRS